jgi:hypothetical protein
MYGESAFREVRVPARTRPYKFYWSMQMACTHFSFTKSLSSPIAFKKAFEALKKACKLLELALGIARTLRLLLDLKIPPRPL